MSDPSDKPACPFWRYSLRLYADRDVQDACLKLQDGAGVDVNLLLFMFFLGQCGRRISSDEASKIVTAAEDWRQGVVVPLRTARRNLKSPSPAIDAATAAALRDIVKKAELEAERLQQEALYARFPADRTGTADPSRQVAAAANVEAYAAVLGCSFDQAPLDALLAAFARQLDQAP